MRLSRLVCLCLVAAAESARPDECGSCTACYDTLKDRCRKGSATNTVALCRGRNVIFEYCPTTTCPCERCMRTKPWSGETKCFNGKSWDEAKCEARRDKFKARFVPCFPDEPTAMPTATPTDEPTSQPTVAPPDPTAKPSDGPAEEGRLIFSQDLEHREPGEYTETQLEADWNDPTWSKGLREGRVSIAEIDGNRALAVSYPQGRYGTSNTGAQFKVPLGGSFKRATLSYRIKFGQGFNFVKGGKIPGLVGGDANTGGSSPDGTDGWSARMMWYRDGAINQYVYHPDYQDGYGEYFQWTDEGGNALHFEPDRWYALKHEIVMNTPGQNDGVIRAWLDGQPALEVTTFRFRDVDTFAIDTLYFSTFFGGGSSWATTRDEVVFFDDFEVRTNTGTDTA
mmetsp:Transcript_32494/g.97785  ORF Transcript_32494/g.97785 Transcript_32494/m.97785 type:complete len:396 (-) Transcript_32494:68-1255(-)